MHLSVRIREVLCEDIVLLAVGGSEYVILVLGPVFAVPVDLSGQGYDETNLRNVVGKSERGKMRCVETVHTAWLIDSYVMFLAVSGLRSIVSAYIAV